MTESCNSFKNRFMKKSFLLLAITTLLLLSISNYGQSVAIGVRGGISIPNLSSGGSQQLLFQMSTDPAFETVLQSVPCTTSSYTLRG